MKNELSKQSVFRRKIGIAIATLSILSVDAAVAFAGASTQDVQLKGKAGLVDVGFLNQIIEFLLGPAAITVMIIALGYTIIKNWGGNGGGWIRDGLTFVVPAILYANLAKILGALGISVGAII